MYIGVEERKRFVKTYMSPSGDYFLSYFPCLPMSFSILNCICSIELFR